MRTKLSALLFALFMVSSAAQAQWNPLNPVKGVKPQPDGALFEMQDGVLRVQICTDSIVRVTYSPASSIPNAVQTRGNAAVRNLVRGKTALSMTHWKHLEAQIRPPIEFNGGRVYLIGLGGHR